ncbi:hypothetical protein ACFOY2_25685 [Nonomuraea purpurea]|uniref:Lipoprotein n=1 Tax=Nonomuraea purpurea TaxID=1849276 RepID=A0ABV8GCB3_9ACTN
MKRILAGLALTTAAALVTAAPAQAAPAQAAPVNPVKALKKQFVSGHGVKISETSSMSSNGKSLGTSKSSAIIEFGKSGVVASDVRSKASSKSMESLLSPQRAITVGGYSYVQGGLYTEDLPEGKKWVRYRGTASGATYNQVIDITRPKVLQTLISRAKGAKGGVYKGSLTYSDLAKAYGQKLTGTLGKIKIDYALAVNSKGLVTTLKSDWGLDFGVLGKAQSSTTTRFSGWGAKVKIKAPAKSLWADVDSVPEDSEIPQELPNSALDSLSSGN